jgi:GT2 family glycosyltransferase
MNFAAPAKHVPTVTIVIVAFEDLEALKNCLLSIKTSTHAHHRLIVIDNSLSDAVEQYFQQTPEVDYRRTGENVGFSKACNLGIAESIHGGADYTLVLNPDTELDPGCLEELVRAAASLPEAGIIGGKIRYSAAPGRLWYAGGRLSYLTGVGKHFHEEGELEDSGTREVTYATGCCMLIPNAVFKRVGMLKESIFMYLDDAEFCLRIRRNGYRIYYNPQATLSHAVGPGMDRRNYPPYYLYFSIRNKPLVADGRAYRFYLHAVALILAGGKLLVYGLSPGVAARGEKLAAIWRGAWDSFFNEARESKRFPRLFGRR